MNSSTSSNQALFLRTSLLLLLIVVLLTLFSSTLSLAASLTDSTAYSDPIYQKLAAGERIYKDHSYEDSQDKTVYLTFDDGPSKLTPKVLDILKEEGIVATFFALGEHAKENPDIVRRLLKEGHTLGNHTYDHNYKKLYSNFSQFWSQIQRTEDVFFDIAGVRPTLIRAPGGTYTNFDAFYFYYLDQAGYTVHDWNMDSGDSKRKNVTAAEIIKEIKNSRFSSTVNLLMHDGSGHEETVKALPGIIQLFKSKGYRFATLSEQTKPMVFHLASHTKWNRSVSLESFRSGTSFVRDRSKIEPPTMLDRSIASAEMDNNATNMVTISTRKAVIPRLPLAVSWGKEQVVFSGKQYILKNQKVYVQLRSLSAELGGKLEWNAKSNTATLIYGSHTIKYKLSALYADVFIQEGRIMVPLRSTMSLLEHTIYASYDVDKKPSLTV